MRSRERSAATTWAGVGKVLLGKRAMNFFLMEEAAAPETYDSLLDSAQWTSSERTCEANVTGTVQR